jgi:prepilin-type processing-associated H-X9-DG protein
VLVVVAIIALLVAILLPALSRARFQAKVLTCRSHLHDIGTSCHMYTVSNKSWYPLTRDSGEDSFYALLRTRLLPNVNVLIDPSTKNVIRPETVKWPEAYDKQDDDGVTIPYQRQPSGTQTGDICSSANGRDDAAGGHSYEYNGCYDSGTNKPIFPLKGKHKKVTDFGGFQSQIALAFDNDPSLTSTLGFTVASSGCTPSYQGNGNNCPQPWDNHGVEGVNILFGDGHAEFVRKSPGQWRDMTANMPDNWSVTLKDSTSALIDQILARSSHPWNYFRR